MSAPSSEETRYAGLRVGIDFDNTIVCYDELFVELAAERGLLAASGDGAPTDKSQVRDLLRAAGREDDWTELQGEAYGARMERARAFDGVKETIGSLVRGGAEVFIVSHKTRHPYRGPAYDLHAAATAWLEREGFFDSGGVGLVPDAVFFEPDVDAKAARIVRLACTHFIDDLPEFLSHAGLPETLVRIVFAPAPVPASAAGGPSLAPVPVHVRSWSEVAACLSERA